MDDGSVGVAKLDQGVAALDIAPLVHDRGGIGIPPRVVLAHGERLGGPDPELEVIRPVGHLEVIARGVGGRASRGEQEPGGTGRGPDALHEPLSRPAACRSMMRSTTYSASSPTPKNRADLRLWSQCMPTK